MKSNTKVFMVAYGGGHANIIRTLYEPLLERGLEVEILALTMATSVYDKYEIPYKTISEYAEKLEYYDDILSLGGEYGKPCHNDKSPIKEIDTICYYGIGMYDLVLEKGEDEAKKLFVEKERKAFSPVYSMKNILEIVKPDIVVMTNSPRFEEASCLAARLLHIPTVRINDLFAIFFPIKLVGKTCVMNDYAKRDAINNWGTKEEDIVVTGQPVFDLKNDEILVRQLKKTYNNGDEKIIVYFGHPKNDGMDILYRLNSYALNRNVIVLHKPHPNFLGEFYNLENIKIVYDDAHLLAEICDVAVGIASTAMLEAIVFDKNALQIDCPNKMTDLCYDDLGVAVRVDINDNWEEKLEELLDATSDLSKLLKKARININGKGNAVEKICNVIISEIGI